MENLQKLRNWETELKNLSYKEKNPETEKGRNQSQEEIIYREYPETEKPRNQAQEVTLHKDSTETEQPKKQASKGIICRDSPETEKKEKPSLSWYLVSRIFRNWDTKKPSSKRYGINIENLQKLRN